MSDGPDLTGEEWADEHAHRLSVTTTYGVDDWATDLAKVSDHPKREAFLSVAESLGWPCCSYIAGMIETLPLTEDCGVDRSTP